MRYPLAFALLAACGTDPLAPCDPPPGEAVTAILTSDDLVETERWAQTREQLTGVAITTTADPATTCGAEIASALLISDFATLPRYVISVDTATVWEGTATEFYVEARRRWDVRLEYRQTLGELYATDTVDPTAAFSVAVIEMSVDP